MSQQQSTSKTGRKRRPKSAVINQRSIIGFTIIMMLALIVFVVRTGSRTTSNVTSADPANAQLVAVGQQLYATRCAGCHGGNLQGELGWPQRRANGAMPATPLDATGPTWQRDDRWIFTTIKHGGQATAPSGTTSAMPAMGGGLTDAEIWAIISFIKQSWPEDIQQQQLQQ
jgi:mono/diheme cytochrome c family protein